MDPNRDRLPDPPSRVQITIAAAPADRTRRLREALARFHRAPWAVRVVPGLVAVALAGAAFAVIATGPPRSGRSGATRATAARDRAGAAAVAPIAAAFGYPHRCVSIAISAADPNYATARVNRTGRCASYHGYVNASFHRVDGVWRLILDEGQLFVPNSQLTPRAARAYPLACVGIAIAVHDPRFARPAFDRNLACGRGRG